MIGVILRPSDSLNNGVQFINNNIFKSLSCSCVGIVNDMKSLSILGLFDGFILQGGSEESLFDMEVVRYCHENNVPLLGICLGMQTMGICFNGELSDCLNHYLNDNLLHEVFIKKDSLLYKIVGKDKILVNSRHNFCCNNSNLFISGVSSDNVVESFEDSSLDFFIGVQWHPEDLFDESSRKLFDYFVSCCQKKH